MCSRICQNHLKVTLEIWCDGENIFVGTLAVLHFLQSHGAFGNIRLCSGHFIEASRFA
jgi:hypothetical protein